MDGKTLRMAFAVGAVALACFLGLLWQPARQVRLHHKHFLKTVEKRNWQAVGRFIGADYRDRWEHDKENVITQCAQVFGQFLFCNIQSEERSLALADDIATLKARIALGGSGGPIAEYAKQTVNSLKEPFTFKWARRSWKPWDWELTEVSQPQFEIGTMMQ